MKYTTVIPFILMASVSSIALAAGEHAGGHGTPKDAHSAHWMSPPAEMAKPNPVKATDESIEQGSKLYQQNCLSCHGVNADGKGMAGMMLNPKPADLRTMSGGHPDGDFFWKIKHGRGAMPAWGSSLNEKQIWHLVNFVQSLKNQPLEQKVEEAGHGHSGKHAH